MGFCVNAKYIKFGICSYVGSDPADIKAYWKLDEPYGGSIVYDSTSNNYDGTIIGSTILGAYGILGTGASFSGSGDYIDCGTIVGNVDLSDFSIMGWVWLQTSINTYNGICGNYGSEYPYFYVTVGDGLVDKIVAHLVIDYSTEVTVSSDASISVADWTHFAVIFDRNGDMRMYINEVLQIDTGDISSYTALNITNTNEFNLGCVGSGQVGFFGDLTIDEIGIYTKVLIPLEIQNNYNSGIGKVYPPI